MTYADVLRPPASRSALLYDLGVIVGGSLFVAASAQVALHLPFSPVPVTGQTLGVLLVGALLGSRRGMLSLLTYLAEGAAGLPVFAGGAGGPAHMLGPTGGYLLGFLVAAYLTGALSERSWDRRPWSAFAAMLLGNIAIYALGLPWLGLYVGAEKALTVGLYPFLIGDLLKLALATGLLPSGWALLDAAQTQRR